MPVTVKIYVDQWIFINFVMDYFLLALVKRLLGLSVKRGRLSRGALSGTAVSGAGTAAVIGLGQTTQGWAGTFPFMAFLLALRIACAVGGSLIMAQVAYGPLKRQGLFRAAGALFFAAVLMGGLIYALTSMFFLQKAFSMALTAGSLLCFGVGAYFFARGAVGFLTENREKRQKLRMVRLSYRGRECGIMALWDTGNQLFDPLSGQPVHILDSQVCRTIVETVEAVRCIPYQTIGVSEGILPAIFFDTMEIETEEEAILLKKPLVALSSRPVSPKGEYQLLLHGSALKGEQCK